MRNRYWGVILAAGLAAIGTASDPAPGQGNPGARAACPANPNALGVSRVIELDTATGPRFGHQQYPDHTILQDGEVVLTFDDGPLRRYTQPIIDALDAHCTKATFFMVGRMALSDPAMVKTIMRRGHTVANHTWSHQKLATLSPDQARAEIELGFSAVRKAAGAPIAPFFRFPYLSDPRSAQAYLQSRQVGMFSIEVDAYDYRTPAASGVIRNVLTQLQAKRKGIILFHDIQPSSAAALSTLLGELKARGYRIVHVVPKTGVQTVAAYDAKVDPEFRRREAIAAANPLAKRAVTWQVGGWDQKLVAGGAPGPVPPGPLAAAPLPPQLPVQAPSEQPRPKRVVPERDWRTDAFGNR